MAIRPIIKLSREFTDMVKVENFAGAALFMLPRLTNAYNRLSAIDRLRVFGIIMERNLFKTATIKHTSPNQMVAALEWEYGDISLMCQKAHIHKMNETGDFSTENRHRTKIFGCIPAYIAVDLADAIDAHSNPAHTPTPRAI